MISFATANHKFLQIQMPISVGWFNQVSQ